MHAALEQARDQHVMVVASSGDTGAISDDGPPRQVSLPASDPLVLAVGGTALDVANPAQPGRWSVRPVHRLGGRRSPGDLGLAGGVLG
jgi:subtilase family serine protease